MCLVCFNKQEITGEVELGNTYRLRLMGETINFSPTNIQIEAIPCYVRAEILVGYTDTRDTYVDALANRVAQHGNRVDTDLMPHITGEARMVLVEKHHKRYNLKDGIEEAKEQANNLRY